MSKGKTRNIAGRGNNFLAIGAIWGLFAAFLCPCPYCVIGTLSFLSMGMLDKTGIGRRLKEKIISKAREHEEKE
jgi:hypothetical protein